VAIATAAFAEMSTLGLIASTVVVLTHPRLSRRLAAPPHNSTMIVINCLPNVTWGMSDEAMSHPSLSAAVSAVAC
jgi:hypothetical protein